MTSKLTVILLLWVFFMQIFGTKSFIWNNGCGMRRFMGPSRVPVRSRLPWHSRGFHGYRTSQPTGGGCPCQRSPNSDSEGFIPSFFRRFGRPYWFRNYFRPRYWMG